jgi:MFS family permease
VINAGGNFAASDVRRDLGLFLQGLGPGSGDWPDLRDVRAADPPAVADGRRLIDRRSVFPFIVVAVGAPAVSGSCTRSSRSGTCRSAHPDRGDRFAFLLPALYAVVAANSPPGRSSTAQGVFGAAGTVGFIVASLVAGVLAAEDILYPFYVFSGVMLATLVIGLAIGGRRLRDFVRTTAG